MDTFANIPISELSLAKKRELLAELLHKEASQPRSYPLSFAQEALWFLHQLVPGSPFYTISCAITMNGPLQKTVLERSLGEMVRRHQVLRTHIEVQEGHPVQVVNPAKPVLLAVVDLAALPAALREAETQRLSRQEARYPFNLAGGPLQRTWLLRLEANEHRLYLSLNHIIADGWSMGVLFQELGTLYAAFSESRPSPLPERSQDYTDYVVWQREWLTGEVLAESLAYWKTQLADLPQLVLPVDRPRPAVQTFTGVNEFFSISPEITSGLKALSQREGVTLFMTLLAGFQALLARYSGQEDISVGTPIANRTRDELEGLVGFLVNTLVLRTDLSRRPTTHELLQRVRKVALDAYAHQDIPFELLVEELQPQRDLSQNPLFQVMVALQNTPYEPLVLPGLKLHLSMTQSDTAKFDLVLDMWESGGGLSGMLEYSTDLYDLSTIRRMLEHYQLVLTGMVAYPDQPILALPILTESEREQLRTWNATEKPQPQISCLHTLFERQVEQLPDAIALVFEDGHCTYSELNAHANRLAHYLRSLGVGPDSCVGLCLERSFDMIIGVLGILKAGGAYVPLDPDYPLERLAFILHDTQATVLITRQHLSAQLPIQESHVLCLDTDWEAIATQSAENPDFSLQTANLAYIIYTSGSTGRPKGIAMPHASLFNAFTWQQQISALPVGARTLQFASLNFDVASQEIISTLCFGQTLILLSGELRRDPEALFVLVVHEAIERLFLPVIMVQQLAQVAEVRTADRLPTALREIIAAGEQLQITPQIVRLFERLDGCLLYNQYGPSESHVTTFYRLPGAPNTWPLLPAVGKPIDNFDLYVLDRYGQLAPVGIPGELYVGGSGLARGYLMHPDWTAERFVPHPFSATPGARLYKTGDLVCYLSDGNLQFLGRLDQQVKIRGFRVEPGEIEALLSQHSAVQDAAILVREDTPGEKRLVAYIAPLQGSEAPTGVQLRQYLQTRLPDYMLPAHFVFLDALPVTTNGKINRRALPAPLESDFVREQNSVDPRTPLEEQIAVIWREILHVQQIGIYDNFFSLGGHSLLATQVVSRIRETFEIEVPLRTLFETPSVAALAAYLDRTGQDARDEVAEEALPIPALARGDEDVDQLLSMLESLSEEDVQALLVTDTEENSEER